MNWYMRLTLVALAVLLTACVTKNERDSYYTAVAASNQAAANERTARADMATEAMTRCKSDVCVLAVLVGLNGGSGAQQAAIVPQPFRTNAELFWNTFTAVTPTLANAWVTTRNIQSTERIAEINAESEQALYGAFSASVQTGFQTIGTLAEDGMANAGTHVTITAEGAPVAMFGSSAASDGAIAIGRDSGAIAQDDGQANGRDGVNVEDAGRYQSPDINAPAGTCTSGVSSATGAGGATSGATDCSGGIRAPITLPDYSPPPPFSPTPPEG